MEIFSMVSGFTKIMFIVVPVLFVVVLIINFNPKLKDKLFGKHIELAAKRVKKGFADADDCFCKHCGASIDQDSKFCKECGKEQ